MDNKSYTGAFYTYGKHSAYGTGHTNTRPSYAAGFNASRSDPVYSNSDTVTPKSLTTFLLIKY